MITRFAVIRCSGGKADAVLVFERREEAETCAESLRAAGNQVILSKVEISLNASERLAAYNEVNDAYLFEDAERQLYDFAGISFEEGDDDCEKRRTFREKYGSSIEELCRERGKGSVLSGMIEYYERHKDCDIAENSIWQEAAREALKPV